MLYPGSMGAALAQAAGGPADSVLWASEGRSAQSAARARRAGLRDTGSVAALVRDSDIVISICPPHIAREVAQQVADAGGVELYLEANAVAPSTVEQVVTLLGADHVVDGAVVGPPPWEGHQAVLHLAGARAGEVEAVFAGSALTPSVVGERLGQASALKACFALQSKALPTLWAVLAAGAEYHGVGEALRAELLRDGIDLDANLQDLSRRATAKAWRWVGEMEQAALTFADAGLPDGFSAAAAQVYTRAAQGLDRAGPASNQDWVRAILSADQRSVNIG